MGGISKQRQRSRHDACDKFSEEHHGRERQYPHEGGKRLRRVVVTMPVIMVVLVATHATHASSVFSIMKGLMKKIDDEKLTLLFLSTSGQSSAPAHTPLSCHQETNLQDGAPFSHVVILDNWVYDGKHDRIQERF